MWLTFCYIIVIYLSTPVLKIFLTTPFQNADNTPLFDRLVKHLRHFLSASQQKIGALSRILAAVLFFVLILAGSGRLFLNSTGKASLVDKYCSDKAALVSKNGLSLIYC